MQVSFLPFIIQNRRNDHQSLVWRLLMLSQTLLSLMLRLQLFENLLFFNRKKKFFLINLKWNKVLISKLFGGLLHFSFWRIFRRRRPRRRRRLRRSVTTCRWRPKTWECAAGCRKPTETSGTGCGSRKTGNWRSTWCQCYKTCFLCCWWQGQIS